MKKKMRLITFEESGSDEFRWPEFPFQVELEPTDEPYMVTAMDFIDTLESIMKQHKINNDRLRVEIVHHPKVTGCHVLEVSALG